MNTRFAIKLTGVAVGIATALTLTACGSAEDSSGKPSVVASTNVWGSIAATIAGPDADVRSIITDPAADPHSHETSAVESAQISDADLVVYNGGGYDEFMDKAVEGKDKKTVDAFSARIDQSDENEHVWYDVETVSAVADQIASALGDIDADHKPGYTDRAAAFKAKLSAISAVTAQIAAQHPNTPVLQTEPLAHYLLLDAGAADLTPHDFQEAIEQETDPSPAAVAETRDLLTGKRVRALVYNVQTEDKVTKDLRGLAAADGTPVVEVTETLPEGTDYIQWQTRNAEALASVFK
ncbi:metal ABC transporter solute-binding protein, Zn/Mn family [Nocardia goodfellowii]|uniref:Zinc/manganese transport system substrate-binding protein n=1 Tax=Nocardia goodfellowii TaxID=882446 RepID=A0ABS4Q7V4_9NOCA|nr:zinc ABC transporter substrate-binding protein [Nocardia goodfellowii]MBP2187773.1 zinc/manganese transport system substrate-binding protein [Nocardia goodfellowii]